MCILTESQARRLVARTLDRENLPPERRSALYSYAEQRAARLGWPAAVRQGIGWVRYLELRERPAVDPDLPPA